MRFPFDGQVKVFASWPVSLGAILCLLLASLPLRSRGRPLASTRLRCGAALRPSRSRQSTRCLRTSLPLSMPLFGSSRSSFHLSLSHSTPRQLRACHATPTRASRFQPCPQSAWLCSFTFALAFTFEDRQARQRRAGARRAQRAQQAALSPLLRTDSQWQDLKLLRSPPDTAVVAVVAVLCGREGEPAHSSQPFSDPLPWLRKAIISSCSSFALVFVTNLAPSSPFPQHSFLGNAQTGASSKATRPENQIAHKNKKKRPARFVALPTPSARRSSR